MSEGMLAAEGFSAAAAVGAKGAASMRELA